MALFIEKVSPQEHNQRAHKKPQGSQSLGKGALGPLLAHITICWPIFILYGDQRLGRLWGLQHDRNPSKRSPGALNPFQISQATVQIPCMGVETWLLMTSLKRPKLIGEQTTSYAPNERCVFLISGVESALMLKTRQNKTKHPEHLLFAIPFYIKTEQWQR